MKIFIKHIIRNIEDNIARTLLMILTLFGVSFILAACIYVLSAAELELKYMNDSQGTYDYMITDIFNDEITLDKLSDLNYNDDLDYYLLNEPKETYYINSKGKEIFINYSTINSTKDNYMELFDLKNDDKLNDGEIIISNTYLILHNLKRDKTIELYNLYGESKKFKIKYVSESNLLDEGFADIIVTNNDYKDFYKNKEAPSYVAYAIYKGKTDITKFTKEVSKLKYEKGYEFDRLNILSDDDLFSANIYVIAVATLVMIIGLVIVYFVLNSIVRIIMQERQPIIGSFRSVGASIKKMNFILLCEMGTYGAIGGILGSISAISIFYSMLKSITSVMFELNYSSINIITFVATTILMILFQLMLSISEILRFKDISIKDCMFNKGDYTYKRDFKKLILGLAFIIIPTVTILYKYQISYFMGIISIAAIFAGVTMVYPYITESFKLISKKTKSPLLKIAIDNISNNKLQISTNIIIIILTSLSIVAISFFNNYMSNLYKKENLFSSDLYIHSYAEDIDFERRLEAIDEIENVSSLYIKDISHEEMKIGGVIQSLSIDGGIKLVNSTNINNLIKNSKLINTNEKNWLNMKDDEIIMSNYFKNKYHIKKGDVITIEFKDEANDIEYYQYYNLKVIDFADTSLINPLTIIVSEEIFNCEQTVDQFDEHYFINLKENVDKKLVKKKIKEEMNDTSVTIENKESYKETLKSEKKEITNIILTIIGIIIAIGLIGIMNNQTVAFLQRSRELAVLYSTCMSRKKLASMILKELLISYSLTTIISVLVALVLNKLIIYTCDVLGILIELKFSILYTILLLFVIALIMLGLYIFIRIKIKGLNIVEELKYE